MLRHEVELGPKGMRLRHYPLWLDAPKKQELAFVSHAHGDHIARHERVIATKETIALMSRRLGRIAQALPATYHRPFELGPLTLELLPAGHVLGSAQLRVTREGRRIVYTGDLNPRGGSTSAPASIAECDVLVMEATFGHPRYAFPPREKVIELLERFVEKCFASGQSPVVLGYALGKSQEAAHALGRRFPLAAHARIFEICELYRSLGVELPPVRRFDGALGDGEVLLLPPNLRRSGALDAVKNPRTVLLSGWALDTFSRNRAGADEMVPLSDHGDFPSLVEYALATKAKHVLTVHGFCDELAKALRARGIDARPLTNQAQLELF